MDPYRQLTPTEMRQVDHAVDDIMAIVKEARKTKEAPCTSAKQPSRQTVSVAA